MVVEQQEEYQWRVALVAVEFVEARDARKNEAFVLSDQIIASQNA